MTRPPHLRSWPAQRHARGARRSRPGCFSPRPRSAARRATSPPAASAWRRASTAATSRWSAPPSHYKVGDIVAYRSTMLHIVVLHRIIAVKGDRYVFKGDNNDFVDPDAARARATWSASCRSRVAARRPRPRTGCTPPSWPLCSAAAWPRCCSWAPSSSAAAATVAGRPSAARAAPCRVRSRPRAGSSASTRRPSSPPPPWPPWPSSRSARSRSPARRPSPRRQDALHREGQLRLPRQGARRAGLPRRRRDDGRPDLPQARAPRPRQGSLPPGRHGPAARSAAPWRSSCASRARPAGAAPSSSPLPSASRATTPAPT